MTTKHQTRVPELFAEALDLDPDDREAFLQQACAGDEDLYREVKSLLREYSPVDHFLEHSALSLATRAISREVTPLLPGTRLGRYEIIRELGSGGMGDVFHARDDIGLEVAIKVLPDYFAQDAERVSRFESEARKMAQVQHPNIAGIHGREVTGGWRFLVLEYVAGETLEARLARGALPVREALSVFSQIADALAVTHRKDIVHRDLKPSNIMLTPSGQVKLLDFGIAKHFRQEETAKQRAHDSLLSTMTQSLTGQGLTPGTLPYMSPEQRIGGKTDQATDIWAFGVVLYEALTGQHPFRRDSREETATAILGFTPDWNLLPADTPPAVRELLQSCLVKDRAQRLRDAGVAQRTLATAQQELERGFDLWHWLTQRAQRLSWRWLMGFATAGLGLAVYLGWLYDQSRTLRVAVVAPLPAQCQPVSAPELAPQLNRLSRVRAVVVDAQTDNANLNLLLTPRCEGTTGKALVKLVNPQGLTLFARLAPNQEQALQKLKPVLEAMAAQRTNLSSLLNAQLNLVVPTLTDLTPEQQRILNLDNWDNEHLIDSALELVNNLIKQKGDSAMLQAALSRAYRYKFKITQRPDEKKKAYDAYIKALTLTPDSADALIAAGEYNASLNATEEAIRYFQQALQQRPNDPQAFGGLGRAYELAQQHDRAEEQYLLAIAFRPDYWGGYNELGNFHSERGEHLLASEYLTTATKLAGNASTYINLGAAYFAQGRFSEALTAYETSIKRAPHPDAYLGVGLIHYLNGKYQTGKYAEAAEYFRQAKDLDANLPEAWGYLGQALHWLPGQQAESRAALRQAIQLTKAQLRDQLDPLDTKTLTSLLAMWLALDQQPQEAMSSMQQALTSSSNQNDSAMLLRAVIVYVLAQQEQTALKYVEKYLAQGGTVQDLDREPFIAPFRKSQPYQNIITKHLATSPTYGEK
jgi:tetratricopeptide (TPR) repeat protein